MNKCNCEFHAIWPFPVSHCEHGKKLLLDIPMVKPIIGNTIPDSVMNIIRGNTNVYNT